MTDNQHAGEETDEAANTESTESTSEARENLLKSKSGEDWDAANTSYTEIIDQRKNLETQLNQAAAKLAQYETALLNRDNPATTVAAKTSALSRLAQEWSVPEDLLRDAIDERAGQSVSGALQPLVAGAQAQTAMVDKYGKGYLESYHDHMKVVNSDPDLREAFEALDKAGKTKQALEFAKMSFDSKKPATSKPDAGERNAASLPTGASGSAASGQRNAAAGGAKKPDLDALARDVSGDVTGRAMDRYWETALDDIPMTFEQAVAREVRQKRA